MPILIQENNISMAWYSAKEHIMHQRKHQCNNLIVSIQNPLELHASIHYQYDRFCQENNLTKPEKISTTIFPKRAYMILREDRHKLYKKYPETLHKVLKGKWGSYFNQMINWCDSNESINQIEQIINGINKSQKVYKSAYTIQITNPNKHLGWLRGGPCLNHVMIQLESKPKVMSLLAVYRNHDFAVKAYGNYIGLGYLLEFLASQTGFNIGNVTCVSSHAYIDSHYISSLRNINPKERIDEHTV